MSHDCPPDKYVESGQECRARVGDCDIAEKVKKPNTNVNFKFIFSCFSSQCTGASPACPLDTFQKDTFICRPANPNEPCDALERYDFKN